MEELNDLRQTSAPDLVAVTETWFSPDMTDSELSLANMSLIRRDRSGNGGGVALYYHHGLQCTEIDDPALNLTDTLWCSLKLASGDQCLVGVVYRAPSATDQYNNELIEILRLITAHRDIQILLMGDFNLPQLFLNEHSPDSLSYKFREIIELTPLHNHVHQCTRRRGLDRPSILDLILTSEPTSIELLEYQAPLGRSDHVVLAFEYVCSIQRSPGTQYIRKVNYVSLSESLCWLNDHYFKQTDTNSYYESLIGIIQQEIAANSRFIQRIESHDWKFRLRNRTRKWINLKKSAWKIHIDMGTQASWNQFCSIRNRVTSLIREDKSHHQWTLVRKMEQNPKFLYRVVNSRTKIKPGVCPVQTYNGMTENARETAEALANFYAKVYTVKQSVRSTFSSRTWGLESLSEVTINAQIVQTQLMKLNVKKSPGADNITPAILKSCCKQLCGPLSTFFNHSLHNGIVPTEWKHGVISPIYKGGRRSDTANYRPVTLLPTISKIMERIVGEQLLKHLESHNLLSSAQHGFRRKRSCLSNLLTSLDDWTKILDEGGCVHTCYIDISKAFDKVNHDLLVEKLAHHGIAGPLLDWIRDYLSDRCARVRIGDTFSRPIQVTSGVPQGSVLGPILFLVYMNDLPLPGGSKMLLFADDMKIWKHIRGTDDCLSLQEDITTLFNWTERNFLPLNYQKSKMLALGRKFDFTYHLGPRELSWGTVERDLGVLVDSSLKFSQHCQLVYKRACRTLGMLKRVFGRFTPRVLPNIINTYIHPVTEYAIQAWAPWLKKDIYLIDKIYHQATKFVVGLQNVPYGERMSRLGLLDFTQRRVRSDLILTYKILNDENDPLHHLLQFGLQRVTRRNNQAIRVPHSRRDCRRYFFSVRVCFVWNYLPEAIVNAKSLATFKSMLDLYMLENHTYGVQY